MPNVLQNFMEGVNPDLAIKRMMAEESIATKKMERAKSLNDLKTKWSQQLEDSYTAMENDPTYKESGLHEQLVDSIAQDYERAYGKKMGPTFLRFIKSDPANAMLMSREMYSSGATPASFFNLEDPGVFNAAVGGMIRARARARTAKALSGEATGETPPTQAPSGAGSAAPAGAPTQQPTAAPEPTYPNTASKELRRLDQEIVNLRRDIGQVAGDINKNPQATTAFATLRQQLSDKEKERRQLILGRLDADQVKKLSSYFTNDLGFSDLASKLYPGMTQGELDALNDEAQRRLAVKQAAQGQGTSPTAPASAPASAPAGTPRPALGRPQTAEEQQRESTRINVEEQPLSDDMLRDPRIAASGAQTRGELRDFNAHGGRPSTAAELAGSREVTTGNVNIGLKRYSEIQGAQNEAVHANSYLGGMAVAAANAGRTGPWLSAFKQPIYNLANLLGIDPTGLDAQQTMDKIQPALAIKMTQAMKGQQSDRELKTAMNANPGFLNTPRGRAILLVMSKAFNDLDIERLRQADIWKREHGGDLAALDDKGRSFDNAFQQELGKAFPGGFITSRVERAFKAPVRQLLKSVQ